MPSVTLLDATNIEHLRRAVSIGFENAAVGLSEMVGKQVRVVSPGLRVSPVEKVPELLGELDEVVVAIYLGVSGDVNGHILLVLSMEAASELIEMLLGQGISGEEELDEMEQSVLSEVANVTGSFFLTAVGNTTNLLLQPSPPYVVMDMAGAALDAPLVEVAMRMDEVVVIDAWFSDDDHQIKGFFLMLPDNDSLSLIADRMGRVYGRP